MKIEKAKELGFCSGVRRAVKLLEEAAQAYGEVETLGAVVHNRQVVENLSQIGVRVVESLEQVQGKVVAIPSHGMARSTIEEIKERGFQIVDTTCPRVRKVQRRVEELAKGGFGIILFGDAYHSEVRGMLNRAEGKGVATLDSEIAWNYDKSLRRLAILSQTTQEPAHFAQFASQLVAFLTPQVDEVCIVNTICDATRKRQEAALELARRVDLVIVIGGYDSSNTQRLAEVCASTGVETHHIEAAGEVREGWLKKQHIGITAGASTPDQVIQEVILKIEGKG